MPRKPFVRSMVATLLGLLIAVPAAVLTLSTPAFADDPPCCQVALNGVPGQFQAGGDPKPFTLRVVNRTVQPVRYITATFVIQANGLNGSQVHLQRQRVAGGSHSVGARNRDGQITAIDQIDLGMLAQLPPGGGVSIQYRLAFSQKAPATGLSIAVRVQPRKGNGGPADAGPYPSMLLAFAPAAQHTPTPTKAQPTPTPTPTETENAVITTPTDESTTLGSVSDSSGGGSMMWIAYTVGALLLLGGVGVIGAMLYRRGRDGEPEWDEDQPEYDQPSYQGAGYAPTQVAGYAPTQVAGYGAPTQAAGYGAPTQAAGFGSPTQAMPQPPTNRGATTHVTPATNKPAGRHSAAPTQYQYPAPQDPYVEVDQTWVDPHGGR